MGDRWLGCYRSGWSKHDLVPAAFSHPAKLAKGLAFRIVDHAIAEGWIKTGDIVCDPFGGVCTIALPLMQRGMHLIACELEEKFVALGSENIAGWNRRFSRLPHWGTARVVCGDSRNLRAVVGEQVALLVSSPPYAEGLSKEHTYADEIRRQTSAHRDIMVEKGIADPLYSTNPANLGNLKAGSVDACISSPPYVSAQAHPSLGSVNKDEWGKDGSDIVARRGLSADYGSSPGQLAAMTPGSVDAVVSSPPYAESDDRDSRKPSTIGRGFLHRAAYTEGASGSHPSNLAKLPPGTPPQAACVISSPPFSQPGCQPPTLRSHCPVRSKWNAEPDREDNYGHTNGQLGQETRDTFWASAKQIVQECHAILRPGGHAIWILKDFVRAGKRVEFCRDWQRLCESCGFTLLHVHQAMLVENYGTQRTTDNGDQEQTVARKSFFRRLAEAKGSPKIDFEEVQCFLRP